MNIEQALTEAIGKMAGRKNGAAIIGMSFVWLMRDAGWQYCALVVGVAALAITLQFLLDVVEVWKTGKDLPENGGNQP